MKTNTACTPGRVTDTGAVAQLETVLHMAQRLWAQYGEMCPPAKCPADVVVAFQGMENLIAIVHKMREVA